MASRQWPQPEQDSQAHRTWSNIVENSTSKSQSCTESSKALLNSPEDYIPLDKEKNGEDFANRRDGSGDKNTKQLKRKLSGNERLQQSGMSSASDHWSFTECTPWKAKDYIQDPTGLNEEIQDFLGYIKPRAAEDAMRCDVVERVEAIIKQLWPEAKVELYGSCQTGLYLPTSDIDLVVHGKWQRLPLRTLENALLENEIADANSIRVLDKATVPIIKVTDKKTEVKIDISFNMKTGVQSADMIKSYMEQYPALPYLTFVLKQFLVNRDLNEVFSGGISSYTVVLMIVSFFQQSAHCRSSKFKDINLGVLLIEFFELYGKYFNYNNVGIRLVGNGSYFNKENVLGSAIANTTHLCIEDPLTPGNYIGKGSFRINDVKRAFEHAFSVLTSGVLYKIPGNESCSILGRITRVRRETIEQRERMLSLLPQTSRNFTMPSYASVATRNTRNTTIRSIHDTKTDSTTGRPEAKPSASSDTASTNCWKTGHSPVERKRNSYHSVLSASASEFKEQKNSSVSQDRFRHSSKENSYATNGNSKRDRHFKERGNKSDRIRNAPERTHLSPSSTFRAKDSDKPKAHRPSSNHKLRSPKRTPSVAETCAMRSTKGVQSSKYVSRIKKRRKKAKRKKAFLYLGDPTSPSFLNRMKLTNVEF